MWYYVNQQAQIEVKKKTMNQTELVQQEVCNQTFNFRIPMALKKELTDRSQSTGEKPSVIVREALKTYLQAS